MPSAVEGRLKPDVDDGERVGFGEHPLPERDHVRVVVRARETSGFDIPADRAPYAADTIGHHRLAVARAAEDDAAIAAALGHGLCRGTNEIRIVTGLFGRGAEIDDFMPSRAQTVGDERFVAEP